MRRLTLNSYYNQVKYWMVEDFLDSLKQYPCAIIKGAPLSVLCYNDCSSRDYADIDILVSRDYIRSFENLFLNQGFSSSLSSRSDRVLCLSFSHQLPAYTKVIDDMYLNFDLNFDIFWGEYEGKRIDIDNFLSDTIEVKIYGVKVKTLPPIKSLIQLILHHYKDMNSLFLLATRKSIKYDMLKDIYYLLKNNLDAIPLDKLYAMSAEYEIIPYVFYVLYYTGQVFDDNDLRQYIKAFRTPEGEVLLNCYGLCAKERKEWKCDFKTRLESENLYELIKNDLTDKDREKIAINKRIFMGVYE